MRETRQSGSEGGARFNPLSLPLFFGIQYNVTSGVNAVFRDPPFPTPVSIFPSDLGAECKSWPNASQSNIPENSPAIYGWVWSLALTR